MKTNVSCGFIVRALLCGTLYISIPCSSALAEVSFFRAMDQAASQGMQPELQSIIPYCEALEKATPAVVAESLPDVANGLGSQNARVRQGAALAMLAVSHRSDSYESFQGYVPVALAQLKNEDESVRKGMAQAFVLVDPRLARQHRTSLEAYLATAGNEIGPLLIRALARSSASDPDAVKAIRDYVHARESDTQMEGLALEAVGAPGLESEPLLSLLGQAIAGSGPAEVRRHALRGLMRTGLKNAGLYESQIAKMASDSAVPEASRSEAKALLDRIRR